MFSHVTEKIDLASNGQEALEKVMNISDGCYDIIILNLDMQILNGYEACSKIKQFY